MFDFGRTSSQKHIVGWGENPIGGIRRDPVAKMSMSDNVTCVKPATKCKLKKEIRQGIFVHYCHVHSIGQD